MLIAKFKMGDGVNLISGETVKAGRAIKLSDDITTESLM